jgi:hypothetical protein
MAKLRAVFGVDKALENDGAWIDYPTGGEKPIRLLIGRMGKRNMRFKVAAEKYLAPHQQEIDEGKLEEGFAETLMDHVLAEGVLFGWENVEGEDGQPEQFSKDAAFAYFQDPQMDEFRDFVLAQAKHFGNFKASEIARKNS